MLKTFLHWVKLGPKSTKAKAVVAKAKAVVAKAKAVEAAKAAKANATTTKPAKKHLSKPSSVPIRARSVPDGVKNPGCVKTENVSPTVKQPGLVPSVLE